MKRISILARERQVRALRAYTWRKRIPRVGRFGMRSERQKKELKVVCAFAREGGDAAEMVRESFRLFVKRELAKQRLEVTRVHADRQPG